MATAPLASTLQLEHLTSRERFVLASWLVRTILSRPPAWFENSDKVSAVFAAVRACRHWETQVALVLESIALVPDEQVCGCVFAVVRGASSVTDAMGVATPCVELMLFMMP